MSKTSSISMSSFWSRQIPAYASFLLMIQNVSIILYATILLSNSESSQNTITNETSRLVLAILLAFDIIIYLLFAIALVIRALSIKKYQCIIISLLFFGWIILSLGWRMTLNIYGTGDFTLSMDNLNQVWNALIIASLFHGLALTLLVILIRERLLDIILVLIYVVLNVLGSYTTIILIGLLIKLLIVPIFGIITFFILFLRFKNQHELVRKI